MGGQPEDVTRNLALPPHLRDRPFTRRQAVTAGVPEHLLRSSRFVQPFRGAYLHAEVELTRRRFMQAAMLVLPPDAAASHQTGLEVWGARTGTSGPLHFSTNTTSQSRRDGIVLHRRTGSLHPVIHNGVRTLQPDRCFADSATTLPFVPSIIAADRLVYLERTTPATLAAYANSVHVDGVVRARLRAQYVCERVESPRETTSRLMLVFARLPRPETNIWVGSATERIARCDLVYRKFRLVVEYDGRWHDDEPDQDAYDELRRIALERAGWTVVVIKAAHMKNPREVVERVYRKLTENGYRGPAPVFNASWSRWFE